MNIHILRSISLTLACSLLCMSCATPCAWDYTDPDKLNRMPKSKYTESHIIRYGLKYAPDKYGDYYLVEKTPGEKFSCYLGRLTLVPAAIVLDAALICGIALGGAAAADPNLFNSTSSSSYSYKPPTMYSPRSYYVPSSSKGGMVLGGPLNGTILPGSDGGMIVGGPMNGTIMPGSEGGMVIGGPMNGTIMPGSEGGMVVGGPMGGTILPGSEGGMVIGGPMGGSIMPGSEGGMIIGGPMNGTIMPGSEGGMIIGGPMNGTIMP